jgi:TP901 family phage tail tape measure protein
MASASGIRMGKVFVEIGADPAKFFAALQGVQKSIGRIGSAMQSLGTKMVGIGTAFAAPLAGAIVAGSKFEDVLLNMRASTGASAEQLNALKASAMQMSQALGVGPTEAAQGFLELLKAGMSVEQVLGGAGQAAIQFAKVGDMAVADAAVVMADAMNVFKVSGQVAANTLSAAADASSTSIQGISLAFSQVSAVAALANQSIDDTAAALAVLANAGIKGSDAGTSLKTMLMRLMAPAADAAEAMAGIGLSTASFRNADGTMKPMVEIIRTLETALAGMDQAARDDIFRRIFGQDAIRAAAVLTQAGVEGFSAMQQGMNDALPVGDKFEQLMSGLSGAATKIYSAIQRLAIAITEALGPSLLALAEPIMNVIGGFATFVQKNQELVASVAKGIAIFVGVGAAIAGVGLALTTVAAAMGLVLSPIGAILAVLTAAGGAMVYFGGGMSGLAELASTTFAGVYAAIAEGDLAGAMDVLWAGLYAGWLRGVEGLMNAIDPWVSLMQNTFTYLSATVLTVWDDMLAKMAAGWDAMESTVRRGWNFLNAAFQGADETARQDAAIEKEMRDRQAARDDSRKDRMAAADATAMGREEENRRRKAARRAETQAAEAGASSASRGKTEARVQNQQFADLLQNIENASSMDQLRDLYGEFDALSANGRLTSSQVATLEEALADAQERVQKSSSSMGGSSPSEQIRAGAGAAAGEAAQSQAEVAGTFSAMAIGGMGVGSSLAQKQLDQLTKIEQNTRVGDEGAVAA